MNSIEFINAIKEAVGDSAVNGTIKNLENVPGKKPAEQLVILSNWYKELSKIDKKMLAELIQVTVNSSIFGFLAVLDGVRVVEDRPDKGQFELYYVNDGNKILLNDTDMEYLHDLYKNIT